MTHISQNGDDVDNRGSRLYSLKSKDSPNRWSNTVTSKKTDGNATTHTSTTTTKERKVLGGLTSETTSVTSKFVLVLYDFY